VEVGIPAELRVEDYAKVFEGCNCVDGLMGGETIGVGFGDE